MFQTSLSRLSRKFSLGLFQYVLCQKKMADIRVSAASLVFTYEASGLDLRVNFSGNTDRSFMLMVFEDLPSPSLSIIVLLNCLSLDFKCIYSVEKQTGLYFKTVLPCCSRGIHTIGFPYELCSSVLCFPQNPWK